MVMMMTTGAPETQDISGRQISTSRLDTNLALGTFGPEQKFQKCDTEQGSTDTITVHPDFLEQVLNPSELLNSDILLN